MKTCPNCKFIWPDEHVGQCVECGNPMAEVAVNGDNNLAFRFAKQVQDGIAENDFAVRAGNASTARGAVDIYDGYRGYKDPVLERAREAIVQREPLRFEEDGT